MILKFIRSLIKDKLITLQIEHDTILTDNEIFDPWRKQMAIKFCLLKIAILEAILGEGK